MRETDKFRTSCIRFARRLRNAKATDSQILRLLIRDMKLDYKQAMEVIGELDR
jgi:hypothetical protein